jgi:tRNA(fMet)-specific endonuclease VapC
MTIAYLLDTNICIYVMKRLPLRAAEIFERRDGMTAISTFTLSELHFGVEKSLRRAEALAGLEYFVSKVATAPCPAAAAAHYAFIRAELQRSGQPIGASDTLIAAHARAEGLTLVTNKQREFGRVPGLKTENWLD